MRFLAFILASLTAHMALGANDGPSFRCYDLVDPTTHSANLIDAQTMASSRSFSINRDNTAGGFGVLTLWVTLTDANQSITRFDATCTVSDDGNASDYTPQDCTAGATCTSTDAGIWQKATPTSGVTTKRWPWRLDVNGLPDIECTFSVGTGSGAAADLLTVKGRICVD